MLSDKIKRIIIRGLQIKHDAKLEELTEELDQLIESHKRCKELEMKIRGLKQELNDYDKWVSKLQKENKQLKEELKLNRRFKWDF